MSKPNKFKKLFEPSHIGKVTIKNRLIKSGAGTGGLFSGVDLHPNRKALEYYEAFARGGIGLVIIENPRIDDVPEPTIMSFDDDKYIPVYRELIEVIHKHNCPAFIQFYHSGPITRSPQYVVAASPVAYPSRLEMNIVVPKALSISEIHQKINSFASAAARAQKAGIDGVEINAGCTHLLETFLSRFWNKRNDNYGPSTLEDRARIVTETIQEIKKRCGADFPVSILMNAIEINVLEWGRNEDYLTIGEAQELARLFEKAGADSLHVRIATIGEHVGSFFPEVIFYPEPTMPFKYMPKEFDSRHHGAGSYIDFAARIKQAVSIPVMTVGGITPEMGEKAIRQGKIDFICLNRSLIADPELPNKVAAGRVNDIAPCTHCLHCMGAFPMYCRINPAVSREGEEGYIIKPTEKKKKVVVVGGGPSGMEAARVAALRGHQVTLYEKASKLGGLLPIASTIKGTDIEDLPCIIRYLAKQIADLGVDIKLGQEATPAMIEGMKPDAVIVAAGSLPATPQIAGFSKPIVVSNYTLHKTLKFYLRFLSPKLLRWLTKLWMPLGKNVIVMGGDIQGCQLAEFLVKRGRKVTIVEEGSEQDLGRNMPFYKKQKLIPWLREKGVRIVTDVTYEEITDFGLTITIRAEAMPKGEIKDSSPVRMIQCIKADNIISVLPSKPDTDFIQSLKGKVPEIYAAGDARDPKLIIDAIADGSLIARKI